MAIVYKVHVSRTIELEGSGSSMLEALKQAGIPKSETPIWQVNGYYSNRDPKHNAEITSFSFHIEAHSPEEAVRQVWTKFFGGDGAAFDSPK